MKKKSSTMKKKKSSRSIRSISEAKVSTDSSFFSFNDLDHKFVWRKKIERDLSHGVISIDDFSSKRQKEIMADIEKIKNRREEMAIEKARHEEDSALLARERARAEFQDWEKKDDEFLFEQSKARSEIRLRAGRVKPIDVLYRQLQDDGDADVFDEPPYMVFKGLTVKETEDLRDDIIMHIHLDRETPTRIEYWEALLVVCDSELGKLLAKKNKESALLEERGVHSSIEMDVKELLRGKSRMNLEALQSQIESSLRYGSAKVVEYWEAVLKQLHIYKAKASLREIHTNKLLCMHRLERPNLEDEDTSLEDHDMDDPDEGHEDDDEKAAGSFSPELLHGDDDEEVIDPEEDRFMLERNRMTVCEELQRRTQEAMEEGDAVFEVKLHTQEEVYWGHDKYRPRKPKYFNRVHTGYAWNKYNRTHYDHDNPPPKTVQGYKFNIFYPDLVHKNTTPKYSIEKDGTSSETCVIKFQAGPPYQDLAFKIVNKEWDYSRKNGFKCTFEGGVLQVYFNFKRHSYRR